MVARLMAGFYWKTSSNKLVTALVKTYCVTIATAFNIMSITFITSEDEHIPLLNQFYLAFVLCLYDIIVVVNLRYAGEYIEDFLDKMENPAVPQDTEAGDKFVVSIAVIMFCLTTRFMFYSKLLYKSLIDPSDLSISRNFILLIMQMIHPVSNFTQIMMFELIFRRMAMLRQSLQQDVTNTRIFGGEEILKMKLRTYLMKYQLILDTINKTKQPVKYLVIV
ncbi:hypothetical protein B5X24_HaOG200906 [Helicoverpa armigera]|nr:hypothetical protein B5X24_HaOG200906 [Helicoverpa armigera]